MICVKCRKKEGIWGVGEGIYGLENAPILCRDCYINWLKSKELKELKKGRLQNWQKYFEKWLGYKWKDKKYIRGWRIA